MIHALVNWPEVKCVACTSWKFSEDAFGSMMKRFQKGRFNMNDLKKQLEQMMQMGGMMREKARFAGKHFEGGRGGVVKARGGRD